MLYLRYIPLIVCLVGLLVFLSDPPDKPNRKEVARIMFAFGLLVCLFQVTKIIYP